MRKKLHRRRSRQMFGKRRRPVGKIVGWVLALAVAGLAGFYTVSLLNRTPAAPADSAVSAPESRPAETTTAAPTTTTTAAEPDTAARRAAFLPLAQLKDAAARQTALDEVKKQGCTAVVFDLKGTDGVLHYAFDGELSQKARTVAEDALTAEELSALLADCTAHGLTAVPRLFAFEDAAAPTRLKSARINWSGDKSTLWLDAKASNGGKAWLNPYSADARAYLTELAVTLKDSGVTALLFDGVCFPKNTYQAYFGTDAETADGYAGALTTFVTELNKALGDQTELLLSAPLSAVLGVDTAVYGGNPLTFGADAVCPRIDDAALTAFAKTLTADDSSAPVPTDKKELLSRALAAVTTRIEFVKGQKPQIQPQLTADLAGLLPSGSACLIEAD